MHIMYVDESGDPGFPTDGDWSRFEGSKLYTRVGAIIHGWKWKTWDQRVRQFKSENGLPWNAELKASDLRRGKGVFLGWSQPRRDLLLNALLTLIAGNQDITLLGVAIDKRKVETARRERVAKPQVRSLELLLERYNFFLGTQKDQAGIVVLDPVEKGNDDNIRYFQSYLQAFSENLKPLHIVESTFFAKSHTSNMIQVADICSAVFYREMARSGGGTADFSIIKPRFWQRDGRWRGYGVKRWP